MERVGVIGAGAWGTALAEVVGSQGRPVLLWARDPDLAAEIRRDRENARRLPGVRLSKSVQPTSDVAEVARFAEVLLLVTPAQTLRDLGRRLEPLVPDAIPVVICAKGIERGTGKLTTEVVSEVLPGRPLAVLSGPTFAAEVAAGLPAAVTLACEDRDAGAAVVKALGSPTFRPYLSDDPVGAAIGGAIKNVIAIACGIVAGRQLGENARAALVTRGLAEVARLSAAKGAKPTTLMGLSGLGDLILTCTSERSRNYAFGLRLGQGLGQEGGSGPEAGPRGIVEGAFTAQAALELGDALSIDLPIIAAVNAVLSDSSAIDATIAGLLARPFREETA